MKPLSRLLVVTLVATGNSQLGCGAPSDLVGLGGGSAGSAASSGGGGRGGAGGTAGTAGMAGSGGEALLPCPAQAIPDCWVGTWRRDEVTACTIELGVVVTHPSLVAVLVDCALITDGAFTVDVQTNSVKLTGQTCAGILNASIQRVDVVISYCGTF